VVFIGKAAAGPAQIRDFDLFKRGDYIFPYTPDIGNGRVFPDPIAAVNTAPQVFRKVTVNVAADPRIALCGVNNDSIHGFTPYNTDNLSFQLHGEAVGVKCLHFW
jgi:hypothetical protein